MLIEVGRRFLDLYGPLGAGVQSVHNDVFTGGNQNNDVAVFKPIFAGRRLLAWAACKGHQADIGGAVARLQLGALDRLMSPATAKRLLDLFFKPDAKAAESFDHGKKAGLLLVGKRRAPGRDPFCQAVQNNVPAEDAEVLGFRFKGVDRGAAHHGGKDGIHADIGADVEIVGQGQVLVDRLDAEIARLARPGESMWHWASSWWRSYTPRLVAMGYDDASALDAASAVLQARYAELVA